MQNLTDTLLINLATLAQKMDSNSPLGEVKAGISQIKLDQYTNPNLKNQLIALLNGPIMSLISQINHENNLEAGVMPVKQPSTDTV